MRIRKLTFQGIGPYVGITTIDFDQLHSGLYLINGPTGAGKTTIIDAIVYGLYGELSGSGADESRLRSHFAEGDDPTEIDLTFETAHGEFRVIRSPKYMRPKKRGEGETATVATCRLFRVAPGGDEIEISRLKGEVDAEIERVVSLNYAQFVQTIVLPQGEFATFLRAKTAERAEVLKRIFNTALYEKVVRVLKEDADAAEAEVKDADLAVHDVVERIGELVGWDDDELTVMREHAKLREDDTLEAALAEPAARLASGRDELATQLRELSTQFTAADEARTTARTEAEAAKALDQARTAAERADETRAAAEAPVAATALLAAEIHVDLTAAEADAWRKRAQQAVAAHTALRPALEAERAVADWPADSERRSQAIAAMRAARVEDETRLDALPALIAAQDAIVALRPTAEAVSASTAHGQALADEAALHAQLAGKEQAAKAARDAAATLLGRTEAAEAEATKARIAWLAGQAAELAVHLQPGAQCPVCGATDHPHPAIAGDDHVSQDELEARESAAQALRASYVEAKTKADGMAVQAAELSAKVTRTEAALADARSAHALEAKTLHEAESAAVTAAQKAKALREESTLINQRLSASTTEITRAETELGAAQEQHQRHLDLVAQARGTYTSVRARIDAITELARTLGALADAIAADAIAAEALASAQAAFEALPQRDGFADLAGAQEQWTAVGQAKERAALDLAVAQRHVHDLATLAERLHDRTTARAQALARTSDLRHVAGLFNPSRGADFGLHIHVLRSLFVNVIEAANRRLETLLGGRFQLELAAEDDGDKRSLQGLGIAVVDSFGGKARPSRTLSGGETFCASLALSLGLADVVRSNAGGVEIGTLFIDEGFGTLDPGVLDEVMSMLQSLGSSGRLVGVISHVAEMRQVITERIDVVRATEESPSSIQVSWMPDA